MTELAASSSLSMQDITVVNTDTTTLELLQRSEDPRPIRSTPLPLNPFRPSCQSLFCCLDSTFHSHHRRHLLPHHTTLLQLSSTRTSPPTPNTTATITTTTTPPLPLLIPSSAHASSCVYP